MSKEALEIEGKAAETAAKQVSNRIKNQTTTNRGGSSYSRGSYNNRGGNTGRTNSFG